MNQLTKQEKINKALLDRALKELEAIMSEDEALRLEQEQLEESLKVIKEKLDWMSHS